MFTGVVDVDAWRDSYGSERTCGDEKTITAKVFGVVRGVEAHGAREFARAIRQDGLTDVDTASCAHEIKSKHGLDRSHEYGVRIARSGHDDVESPVHAVQEEHVGMSSRTEHGFGSSRTSAASAVSGKVFGASIRFALDDASCGGSFRRTMHEDGADERWSDLENFAVVKRARKRLGVECCAGEWERKIDAFFTGFGHVPCRPRPSSVNALALRLADQGDFAAVRV